MNITNWGLNQNEIDRARGVLRDDERVGLVGLLGYVAALFGDF